MTDIAFFNDKREYGRYFEHRINRLASQHHIKPQEAIQIVLTGIILESEELEAFCKSHDTFLPLIISAREELKNPEKRKHLIYAIKEAVKPFCDLPSHLRQPDLKYFTIKQCLKGYSKTTSFGLDFSCDAFILTDWGLSSATWPLPIYFYCGNSYYNPLYTNKPKHVNIDCTEDNFNLHFLKLVRLFFPHQLKSIHFNVNGGSVSDLKGALATFDSSLLANTSLKIVADKDCNESEFNVWEMVPSIEVNLNSRMSLKDKNDWYYRVLQNTKVLKLSFESDSLTKWSDWHKEELFDLLNQRSSFTLVIVGDSSSIQLLKEVSEWAYNTTVILDVTKPTDTFNKKLKNEFGDRLIISETGEISLDLRQPEKTNLMNC
ncbi:hypothetical protein [Legionella shakespearei]|uniref:Uncharacterized protein n=1 Tax=Legionella shakespearei DSM 23087 TaxID=1122169 RepID=A0A0W0YSX3_9GAMM|nr:hypothetical protein [Legionella shakespearei]KTD59927.1 hypothetical protein Lsha_1677 [Legionella shakespearei DSM 23087]